MRPAQAVFRPPARPVLAADPFAVTEPIERREDFGVIHFALGGLVPRRRGRDLHMTNEGTLFLEGPDESPPHDWRVLEADLHAHVRPHHLAPQLTRLLRDPHD